MANFMWPGAILAGIACILLIFVSVGSPTWDRIFFLEAEGVHFGPFGFTGSGTSFGYLFPDSLATQSVHTHSLDMLDASLDYTYTTSRLNTKNVHNLTKTLFLHPLAAGFAGLAAIAGGCLHRFSAIFFTTLAFLTTLVAWVCSMVLIGIVRHRIRDAHNSDSAAQYGNAEWMTLGALVALLVAWILIPAGAICSRRRKY